MPDFTMCLNEFCPLAQECARITATPSKPTQAYGFFEPQKVDGKITCNNFREMHKSSPSPWSRRCSCGQSYIPKTPGDGVCPTCKNENTNP